MTRAQSHWLLIGLSTMLFACESTRITQCPKGFVPGGAHCVPADGGLDGGGDAARDAGPCNGVCTGETPLCLEDGGTCVECLADEDCADPEASRCEPESHSCKPCASHGDCIGVADGRDKCDLTQTPAVCYGCEPATEFTDCDGTFCDGATRTCTSTAVGDKATCVACTADSDCVANHRCVPMTFGEPAEAHGNYCLRLEPVAGCERPYSLLKTATSVSGESGTVCILNEELTTCEALLALESDTMCPSGDTDCPDPAGLCRKVGGLQNRCTYECTTSAECPGALGCGANGGGDKYCGGKAR